VTAGQLSLSIAQRLAAAGIDSARLDARLLVAEVLGVEPNTVFMRPDMPLSPDQVARAEELAARRQGREPMSHILGRRGFWTLTLAVTADTLDPRGDTETVVEAVLDVLSDRQRPWRLLDFGTGTGAILLALLAELPNATGVAVDRSAAALAVARANAQSLGMGERAMFIQGDWGRGLHGLFDAIVSNPPYIPDQEIAGLEPEVARFEPRLALAGGADGLDCFRALAPDIARLLAPGGVAALEVGQGQDEPVSQLLQAAGLQIQPPRRDLAGIARCVVARA
jgi:release factor glutamine methyltransferase